jgi:geranylgeranyl diphosphate synthase type II
VSGDVWVQLAPRQAAVESSLGETLARLTGDAPATVVAAMGYSLLAPGKRLRPLLGLLACEAVGGATSAALPAAVAVEMIHTYSLIHDDLPAMDDDDLRRGRPTCHVAFGEAMAILAADALLTLAFEVLADGYAPATAAVCTLELARGAGAAGMVGGQVLDLTADGKIAPPAGTGPLDGGPKRTVADLEAIHRRKTGALFRSALRLGVHAAGVADRGVLRCIDEYAAAFGLAFQVTDDLLDVTGDTATTGKRVNKDADRGKLTYPGLLGQEASRRKATELGAVAVAAAESFGPAGRPLADLARYVVSRDR